MFSILIPFNAVLHTIFRVHAALHTIVPPGPDNLIQIPSLRLHLKYKTKSKVFLRQNLKLKTKSETKTITKCGPSQVLQAARVQCHRGWYPGDILLWSVLAPASAHACAPARGPKLVNLVKFG